jgi:hypothetical protein
MFSTLNQTLATFHTASKQTGRKVTDQLPSFHLFTRPRSKCPRQTCFVWAGRPGARAAGQSSEADTTP